METGTLLSQTDVKKILSKVLQIDEKQITTTKYSFMIMGVEQAKLKEYLK